MCDAGASRGLMQGLVMMAGAVPSEGREEVYKHVLCPNLQAFHTLLETPNFTKDYQQENYRKQVTLSKITS